MEMNEKLQGQYRAPQKNQEDTLDAPQWHMKITFPLPRTFFDIALELETIIVSCVRQNFNELKYFSSG